MNHQKIRDRANELIKEHQHQNGRGEYFLYHDDAHAALVIIAEWAAGVNDLDRPEIEKVQGGHVITYNGIKYNASHGFISPAMPNDTTPVSFVDALQSVINRYSKENESNTPDYALAGFLFSCLGAYAKAVKERDAFHKTEFKPPFKPGGVIHDHGGSIREEGPEAIVKFSMDLNDPDTVKTVF